MAAENRARKYYHENSLIISVCMADPRGWRISGAPLGQFFLMQLSGKINQNNRLVPPSLAPPPLHEILNVPLTNYRPWN